MTGSEPSLAGRGREAMVPERGLPFDVTRRRGTASAGSAPGDPGSLHSETVAAVFDAIDWDARRGSEPEPRPALGQPAGRYLASFPWAGPAGETR